MKKILLIGGGGHCRTVLRALRSRAEYTAVGIVDSNLALGSSVDGVQVVGRDADLKKLFDQGFREAFIAFGSIQSSKARRQTARNLKEIGFALPAIVDASALVPSPFKAGDGALIAAGVVIQPGTVVGENAIINTGAIVDHDCTIGDFAHLAPGTVLSGGVSVGEGTLIGTGATVIEYRKIGKESVIGAGSVVVSDLPDDCKAFGNPCKVREESFPAL